MSRRCLTAGCLVLALAGLFSGCRSVPGQEGAETEGKEATGATEEKPAASERTGADSTASVDVGFLLSMNYEEARQLSPHSIEIPPNYRIAADEITVTSIRADGSPRRVRARGHVFLQIDYSEELIALGQEAAVGGSEAIIRGKPLLKRGKSVVEGLEDRTVFYIDGVRLQVIGLHRLTNQGGVTPSWRGSWKDGPNPLLPALDPNDLPKSLRATPLLPTLSEEDKPAAKGKGKGQN